MARSLDSRRNADVAADLLKESEGRKSPDKALGENELGQEKAGLRNGLLKDLLKLQQDGVFSAKDKEDWDHRLSRNEITLSDLKGEQVELKMESERARAIKETFDEAVHGAEHEHMLKRGEHDEWDENFINKKVADREGFLKEIQDTLKGRVERIKTIHDLNKEILNRVRPPLEAAEFYDEKLELLEHAETLNKNLNTYAGKWEKHVRAGKISKKTWGEYKEWFMDLGEEEQKKAIEKAEKKDIKPRVDAWEVHHSLPKEYQNPDFDRMGLKERQGVLRDIEEKLDQDFHDMTREGRKLFCAKEIAFYEAEYDKPQRDVTATLKRKINFRTMMASQIKVEEAMLKQFKIYPLKVQKMFREAFDKADSETRKKMLKDTIEKTALRYNHALEDLKGMDPHVSKEVQGDFDDAETMDKKELVIQRAKKFDASMKRCFKKLEMNGPLFHSGVETHKKIYLQKVHTLEDAFKMEEELTDMIEDRRNLKKRTQKLHPILRERFEEDKKLSEREKQLDALEKIDQSYKNGTIPTLVKLGERAKQADDIEGAFAQYMQALKLDPDNKELKTIAAELKQKGATGELVGKVSETDEKEIQKILDALDREPAVNEEARKLAVEQLLNNLVKKNIESTGAGLESTTSSREKHVVDRIDDDQEKQVAQDLKAANDKDYTLGDDEVWRKKIELKNDGTMSKETKEATERLLGQKVHKGTAAKTGLSEIKQVDASGQEVSYTAASRALAGRRQAFLAKREKAQQKAVEKSLGKKKAATLTLPSRKKGKENDAVEDALDQLAA